MTAQYPKHRPDLFWLVVGIMALIAFLSSCSKDYYINKYCPKVKDSTHVEIIRHDSTIITEIIDTIPADTLRLIEKVPCADFEIVKETKRQKITIKVKNGELTEEAICKEYEFKYFISNTITTLTEKTFHSEVYTATDKKRKNHGFWLGFATGGIVLSIVWNFKKVFLFVVKMIKLI